jgi:hypothetical protein
MDAGLNVVDTAPSYEDGYSEEVVAMALQGRRDGMFVIDKVDHFDRPVAPQIEGSLNALTQSTVARPSNADPSEANRPSCWGPDLMKADTAADSRA